MLWRLKIKEGEWVRRAGFKKGETDWRRKKRAGGQKEWQRNRFSASINPSCYTKNVWSTSACHYTYETHTHTHTSHGFIYNLWLLIPVEVER